MRENRADVGFVEGLDPLDGLEAKEVARDRIVLVVAADHRWAKRRAVNPRELAGGRWISRESGSGTRAVAAEALATVGVELSPDLSLASLEGVKRSLAAGGFALISELALEPDLAAGRLVTLPLKGLEIERSLVGDPPRRRPPQRAGPPLLVLAPYRSTSAFALPSLSVGKCELTGRRGSPGDDALAVEVGAGRVVGAELGGADDDLGAFLDASADRSAR